MAAHERDSRVMLVADAYLVAAAATGLFAAMSPAFQSLRIFPSAGVQLSPGEAMAFTILILVVSMLASVVGPAAVWVLHGRPTNIISGLGAMLGIGIGCMVAWIPCLIAMLLAQNATVLLGTKLAGQAAVLVPIGGVLVALVVYLDLDVWRNLSRDQSPLGTLGIIRIVATVAITLGIAATIAASVSNPKTDVLVGVIIALTFGSTFSATVVGFADVAVSFSEQRQAAMRRAQTSQVVQEAQQE